MSNRAVNRGLVGDRVMIDSEAGIFFQPVFDRILVEPVMTKDKTAGGIIIPDSAKIEETRGKVVATGYGYFDQNNNYVERESLFNIGDVVVFKEYTGTHVTLDCDGTRKQYLIIWDRDVLGVLLKASERD